MAASRISPRRASGRVTLVGQFAEPMRHLSVMAPLRAGCSALQSEKPPACPGSSSHHLQNIEFRQGRPALKARLSPLVWDGRRNNLCRTRLPILLNACRSQTSETMSFESVLPGEELLHRDLVGTACFFERDPAAPHRGNYRGLATGYPSWGVRRR
jgi:hypothetical protein